jgi:pimeloyl-ACP methyl ester carboxylesterase
MAKKTKFRRLRRALFIVCVLVALSFVVSLISTRMSEKRIPPAGSFLEVDGIQMHYLDMGPKDTDLSTIILIHGASANLLDMKMALGERLSAKRRVILVDRPGHGYSGRPKDGHLLSVQSRAIHQLLTQMNVHKPIIAGQSFGGVISLNYALEYPDDVAGLVLMAPVSHEWPGDTAIHYKLAVRPLIGPVFRRTVIPLVRALSGKGIIDPAFWPLETPENYFDRSGSDLLFRPSDFKYDAQDRLFLKEQIMEQQKHYGKITAPTRIITGTHDTSVSPGLHSMSLEREMPNASLNLITGVGHPIHHFAQDEIKAEIAILDGIIADGGLQVREPVQ